MTLSSNLRYFAAQVRYSCRRYRPDNLDKFNVNKPCFNQNFLRRFASSSPPLPRKKIWLYTLAGVFGGAVVGSGYSYYRIQKARIPIINEGTGTVGLILASKPEIKPSRSVSIMCMYSTYIVHSTYIHGMYC